MSSLAAADSEWLTTTVIGGVALTLLVGVAFAIGARRIRQPAVVGEIAAGICLGPSLLGLLPGDLPAKFFPAEARAHLGTAAQIGLILFMFVIGWEFDGTSFSGRRKSTGIIWLSSIACPLALGMSLAALIYGTYGTVNGKETGMFEFTLYLGVAMSITAFPVLARIVADQGLQFSRAGALSLALAAADDVLAWCMLALVVALVTASGTGAFVTMLLWSLVYVAGMLWIVKPLLAKVSARLPQSASPYIMVFAACGAFGSAWLTSEIGIHAIFGAFFFGLVMPRDRMLMQSAFGPMESASKLLLPLFFVVTGLSVDLTTMTGQGLLVMLAVITVACLGKLGGVAIPAKLTGMNWRDATTLGLLMNTRGLTELVILNVGLQLGLLSVELFSAMVIMALVTTAMAAPLLSALLARPNERAHEELLKSRPAVHQDSVLTSPK
ncbi:cation:proton antiporter [Streptomyces sp. P17]|uniref:cation:proton antiporter n=1 Tax=Streptomyces sp. P17 TaxID=3074716 RepID=UPI0028F42131|nr:cation:proton antiporter [Streptomyces sp. P17]MDT9694652.1 cation:proton antiporter [Streptomyces sp. P17]